MTTRPARRLAAGQNAVTRCQLPFGLRAYTVRIQPLTRAHTPSGGYYDHVPPPPAVEPDDALPHSLGERSAPLHWLWRHSTPGARSRRPTAPGAGAGTGAVRSEVPDPDAPHGRYDRYGFRVPAVIVSPYSKPGHVSSTVYDHTSALKLIEEKWNLPALTRRDAAATAPWDMIDLDARPAFLAPPDLPAPARTRPG